MKAGMNPLKLSVVDLRDLCFMFKSGLSLTADHSEYAERDISLESKEFQRKVARRPGRQQARECRGRGMKRMDDRRIRRIRGKGL